MIPIMAVGFELGVEVTHPVGESVTTGFLMSTGKIFGIALVRIITFVEKC